MTPRSICPERRHAPLALDPASLTPLEVASGLVLGSDPLVAPLPRERVLQTPHEALEQAVLPVLQREPCAVSFSGGRDSSAVLAVATRAARRQGLPAPVPVTLRFPFAPSQEYEWQEAVVRHLALDDWQRIDLDDELDMLGPYSTAVIRRHGIVWPSNAHFHVPIFERVTGGSVLTGVGGDELMSPGRWLRVGMLLAGRARPRLSDLPQAIQAVAPLGLRRAAIARSVTARVFLPWLRSRAAADVRRQLAADTAAVKVRFDSSLRDSWWRSRYRRIGAATLRLLGADHGVEVHNPLHDALFLRALATRTGAGGYWSRTAAMRELFGHLLPTPVIERSTKARFDAAFWGSRSREFARNWDGRGLDEEIVDAATIRSMWINDSEPPPLTWLLLKQAWLAATGDVTGLRPS